MTIEIIKVPDIGGGEGVEVIEICVAVGDHLELEQSLVVLESDKASMEVPAPMAGIVTAISISLGDALSEGDVILELETAADSAVAATPEAEPQPELQTETPTAKDSATASPITASSHSEEICVPDIGGSEDVDVIEVCVAVGDSVAEGDSLVVLETDKASMEVPSPVAGTVLSIAMHEGDTTAQGASILHLQVASVSLQGGADQSIKPEATSIAPTATSAAPQSTSAAIDTVSAPPAASTHTNEATSASPEVYAGPAVRRLAREMGVDLSQIKGSGPRGRIAKDDVKAFVKTALSQPAALSTNAGIEPIPAQDFAKFGEVSLEPRTKIHRLTATNMLRSWLNVPHVTQFDEADISELEDFRQGLKAEAARREVKITPMPFLLKAAALALREHPAFNASLHSDGQQMVYKHYVHIGMAVDTPAGLVVPVIRDVDQKSIWQLAAETAQLAAKAKARKLTPADMQGGCFTISSLGGLGGQGFTPIINAPEVAILGVSKLAVKPVWDGDAFQPRKMLPLALSYDHRAINGADAGRFFNYLIALLADIRQMVL